MDFATEVKNLILAYQQKGEISFKSFRETWKEVNFSVVHQAAAESTDPSEIIHGLYYHFLSYLFLDQPLIARAGTIYGLYLLYSTQLMSPKAKLTITLTVWLAVKETLNDIKQARIADAYQCFKKMSDEGGVLYSATLHPAAAKVQINEGDIPTASDADGAAGENDTRMQEEQSEGSGDGLDGGDSRFTSPEVIDVAAIERIAKMYGMAKLSASGAHARDNGGASPAAPSSPTRHAPPSLNVAHADLPGELRSVLSALQKSKDNRAIEAGLQPHGQPLFTTTAPPL